MSEKGLGGQVPAPLELDRMTYSYDKQRGVVDLTLTLNQGEIFGFLGPNGAGKTTTIRVLMGLMRPAAGSARIFGHDCWKESTSTKRLIGFLPGDLRLYEHMTGNEFLEFFASFRDRSERSRGADLADRLDVELDSEIKHLSKGNRQKLAVVQALMHDAPLLILDEPSSGLDPLNQALLLEFLSEERARGKTIFLSSHVLPEVERIADRVGIIRDGRLIAVEAVAYLRATRERVMELALASPVAKDRFDALPNVRVISASPDALRVSLGVHGDLRPLLSTLATLPVDDLVFGPPDLESVFLHYYDSTASPDEVRAAP